MTHTKRVVGLLHVASDDKASFRKRLDESLNAINNLSKPSIASVAHAVILDSGQVLYSTVFAYEYDDTDDGR